MTTTETPDPITHARAMTALFAFAVENELPEYLVAHLERVAERACLRVVADDPNPAPPPGAVTWTVRRDGEVVGEVVAQLWHEARGLAVVEYGEGVEV